MHFPHCVGYIRNSGPASCRQGTHISQGAESWEKPTIRVVMGPGQAKGQ